MAPVKEPKKMKKIEKPIEKPITKVKNKKKKNYESFSIYIYKLLRSLSTQEHIGVSEKSVLIMNNFVNDMLENIAIEAGRLVLHGKKSTLSSREIQSAIKLLLPPEIAKHANIEGLKAVTMFHKNSEKKKE